MIHIDPPFRDLPKDNLNESLNKSRNYISLHISE
jgi:hypothetical protein